MEIDMTKFIDDYLAREGITRERADALRYKINASFSISIFILYIYPPLLVFIINPLGRS